MKGMEALRSVYLTRRARRAAQVVLIVLALIGSAWPAHVPAHAGDVPAAASPGQTPLAELLDGEGRLDLASGFRGSIDVRGWRLVSGPDEAPAFAPLVTEESGQWSGIFRQSGIFGIVFAVAVDDTGNLYAGGEFTNAGGVTANNIAKWDGSAWSALGSGINGAVHALAVDGAGKLYAGGNFTSAGSVTANNIAKWNGSAWSYLGTGMSGEYPDVLALAVDDAGIVYAGGSFATAGGVTANCIAKWNGSTWSSLGNGMNSWVYALAVDGAGMLYAGGEFSTAGDVTANYIAKWDGTSWSALGTLGTWAAVRALAFDGTGKLYAGGASTVAKWDGTTWSVLGGGMESVGALAVDDAGNLYAGGWFTTGGDVAANYIAKWNGSAWSALGSGIYRDPYANQRVHALAVDGTGNLYAGGEFTAAGGVVTSGIAKWNGTTWFALDNGLGRGMNNSVSALAVDRAGNLYAGGEFSAAGGVAANQVAKWDGSAWSALGSGEYGSSLAVDGNGNLYAAGYADICKWDGSAWSGLAWLCGGYWNALAVDYTGNLYAGGSFTSEGCVAANSIAKWDGSAWSALGSGIDMHGEVNALAVDSDGNLYAGGRFTSAGGLAANNIAKWNGSTWSALGSGMNAGIYGAGWVNALAVDGAGNLYAGGNFTIAGGVDVNNNIAKWDGSAWYALGSGLVGGEVYALAVDSFGNVYAGSGSTVSMWNGSAWSALGSGMNAQVLALVVDSIGDLYAGGDFTTAGGKPSAYIGAWEKPGHKLILTTTGNGSGRVTGTPPGIDCGVDCREKYAVGTVVTLTATAGALSTFSGWSGACGGAEPCIVTMNAAKAVTATFTLQSFPLTVGKAGTGSGTVASNPAGIDCGATCNGTFTYGTVVTLTATAGAYSTFTGWSGACVDAGPCVVTLNAAKAVTATFTLRTFPLTVSKAGIGTGTVTSTPAGINCGNTCNADLSGGTVVTLTALPDPGASFSDWSGACSSSGSCAVTMDAAKDVTATFGVPGAVTPQASTMYYGQQLQVGGVVAAAAPVTVTKLVVFTGTVPSGIFLVGVEGSEPYAGEIAASRLINRLLAEGCGAHGACTAVNVAVYTPDGTHTEFVVTSPVMTDHLYLPHVRR